MPPARRRDGLLHTPHCALTGLCGVSLRRCLISAKEASFLCSRLCNVIESEPFLGSGHSIDGHHATQRAGGTRSQYPLTRKSLIFAVWGRAPYTSQRAGGTRSQYPLTRKSLIFAVWGRAPYTSQRAGGTRSTRRVRNCRKDSKSDGLRSRASGTQSGWFAAHPTLRPDGLVRGFFETLLDLGKRSELPLLSTLQRY